MFDPEFEEEMKNGMGGKASGYVMHDKPGSMPTANTARDTAARMGQPNPFQRPMARQPMKAIPSRVMALRDRIKRARMMAQK